MQHWLPTSGADGGKRRADLLAFAPVPRNKRAGGWTAERQRAFIAALAECGSVRAAARTVGMSPEGAYQLRLAPRSDSFRAAWEAAQESGLRGLADIAMERAREGIPVPVFYKGEQVGEKRWYNDRLLMFMLKHHLPARYDSRPLAGGTKHPATLAREAAAACPVCRERGEAEARADTDAGELDDVAAFLDAVFARYALKVGAERRHRLAGNVVAADFTLRQLTHIELILDVGGRAPELIRLYAEGDPFAEGDPGGRNAGPISEQLAERRQATWDSLGDPPRPPLDLRPRFVSTSEPGPGDTQADRLIARKTALARIAAAQAMWEAAASEETWARFDASGGG